MALKTQTTGDAPLRRPTICERKRANGSITYYAQIGRKQVGLGTDPVEAKRQFGELLAGQTPKGRTPNPPVKWLINEFLAWSKKNCEAGTHEWYRGHLEDFRDFVGPLNLIDLKRHEVTRWLDRRYSGLSANYRHGAVRSVKRVFKWAEDEDLIERSPLAKVKLLTPENRELYITKAQWSDLLKLLENKAGKKYDDLRDYLTVIWETGCRPQEARMVEAKFIDRANRRWVFPIKKSKGKKRQRVVYQTDAAFAITERLAAEHPTGPIFRTSRGEAWDKNKVRCRFRRLQEKMGIPQLCAYTLRHSWATVQLEAGMDRHIVAKLMGHTSTLMLESRYSHIESNAGFLSDCLNRSRQ